LNLSSLIILGAGHFGQRALFKCSHEYPNCRITIVDRNGTALKNCTRFHSCETVCDDGISYLNSLSQVTSNQSLWIIPSIPIHVAFEWVTSHLLRPVQRIDIPDAILKQLPNPMAGGKGTVFMSYATFKCVDNCPEPVDHCYITGQPRLISLFEKLQGLQSNDFLSIVLQSKQILPGIGGFQFSDLIATLSQVDVSEKPVLLSTACRCHGVMDAFSVRKLEK